MFPSTCVLKKPRLRPQEACAASLAPRQVREGTVRLARHEAIVDTYLGIGEPESLENLRREGAKTLSGNDDEAPPRPAPSRVEARDPAQRHDRLSGARLA